MALYERAKEILVSTRNHHSSVDWSFACFWWVQRACTVYLFLVLSP